MPDYISNNLTAIIIALIGLLVAGVVVKVVIKSKRTDNSNRVNQSNNRVSGDQAGRDINKR
jgi:heme/copper-type cytochrome/quinol oxidase subunit 2